MKLDVVKQVIEKFVDMEIIISDNNKKPDSLFFDKEHKVRHFKSIDEIKEFAKDKYNIIDDRLFDIYTFSLKFPNDNYIAFDIDRKDGKDGFVKLQELSKELGRLPLTYTEKTPSGGLHYYYKLPDKVHLSSTEIIGKNNKNTGLEIKQHAKITIADGDKYTIVNDLPVATLPDNWVEFLRDNYSKSEKKPTFNYIDKPTVADDANKAISDAYDYAVSKEGYPTNGNRYYFSYTFGMAMALNGVQEFEAGRQYNLVGGDFRQFEKQIESAYFNCDNPGKWAHMYCDDDVQRNFEIPKKETEIKKEKIEENTFDSLELLQSLHSTLDRYDDFDYGIRLQKNEYISDHINFQHLKHKRELIKGDPGSGKTEASTKIKGKVILVFPTISLGSQKAEEQGIHFVKSKVLPNNDSIQACTIDSFKKFDPEFVKEATVILDESHNLITTNNYRAKAMRNFIDHVKNAKQIIALTATPVKFSFFNDFHVTKFYKKDNFDDFEFCFYENKDKLIDDNIVKGKTLFIFNNSKDGNDTYVELYQKKGYKVLSLHADNKDSIEAISLRKESKFTEHYDIVFFTAYYQEGIDIYDCNLGNVLFLDSEIVDPCIVRQFANRVRNKKADKIKIYKPMVSIMREPKRSRLIERIQDITDTIIERFNDYEIDDRQEVEYKALCRIYPDVAKHLIYDKETCTISRDDYGIESTLYNEDLLSMNTDLQYYIENLEKQGMRYAGYTIDGNKIGKKDKAEKNQYRQERKERKEAEQNSIIEELVTKLRDIGNIDEFEEKEYTGNYPVLKERLITAYRKIQDNNSLIDTMGRLPELAGDVVREIKDSDSKWQDWKLRIDIQGYKKGVNKEGDAKFYDDMFELIDEMRTKDYIPTIYIKNKMEAIFSKNNMNGIFSSFRRLMKFARWNDIKEMEITTEDYLYTLRMFTNLKSNPVRVGKKVVKTYSINDYGVTGLSISECNPKKEKMVA